MAGEKYIVAATENSIQIAVRNILNPHGYIFLERCNDAISLLRLVRSYHPDFIVVDTGMQAGETKNTLETVDSEMLCACILLGGYEDTLVYSLLDNSNAISFCPKPLNRDLLIHTVNMAIINYRRVLGLDRKLREMAETVEKRKLIDQAKLILMEQKGLSEKEAYELMKRRSMNERVPIKFIAEIIINMGKITGKG